MARALQSAQAGRVAPIAEACVRLYTLDAHERAYNHAKRAVRATLADATACRAHLAALRRCLDEEPCDVTALRDTIVDATVAAGRYPLDSAKTAA